MRLIDLTENITPDLEKKFGRVLFGEWQHKKKMRSDREKDTAYEGELLYYVESWFAGKTSGKFVQKRMIELSKIKDNYPTLLLPDPAANFPKLYRGIAKGFKPEETEHYFGQNAKNTKDIHIEKSGDRKIRMRNQVYQLKKTINSTTYKPKRIAESWTTSVKFAIDILHNHLGEDTLNIVIIEAKVPENERLLNIQTSNNMYSMKQNEIIRVSNKPIEAKLYYVERIK